MSLDRCPVCNADDAKIRDDFVASAPPELFACVTCRICGEIKVGVHLARAFTPLSSAQRGQLSGYLYQRKGLGTGSVTLRGKSDVLALLRDAPPAGTTDDVVTRLLRIVADDAGTIGSYTPVWEYREWAAKLRIHAPNGLDWLFTALVGRGWIHRAGTAMNTAQVGLLISGWEEHYQRQQRGAESRSVFIATWANTLVSGGPVNAVCQAVEKAGLLPIVGVRISGQDRVTEDIEAEIRGSRLLIADFTGNRTGVYWEAGFARGLGRPVIYSCHASWSDMPAQAAAEGGGAVSAGKPWREQLHFDTAQFPHIFWETAEELGSRVLSRIKANGWGEIARPTQ